eukprot:gene2859-3552_t
MLKNYTYNDSNITNLFKINNNNNSSNNNDIRKYSRNSKIQNSKLNKNSYSVNKSTSKPIPKPNKITFKSNSSSSSSSPSTTTTNTTNELQISKKKLRRLLNQSKEHAQKHFSWLAINEHLLPKRNTKAFRWSLGLETKKILRERRERQRAILERIKSSNDPKVKEKYSKFYQDFEQKEREKRIAQEIIQPSNNYVYDKITLEPLADEQTNHAYRSTLLSRIRDGEKSLLFDPNIRKGRHEIKLTEFRRSIIRKAERFYNRLWEKVPQLIKEKRYQTVVDMCEKMVKHPYYYQNAAIHLGSFNLQGYGAGLVKVNHEKAMEYFKMATKSRNKVAFGILGEMYMKGMGVESPDMLKAVIYFTLAADRGLKSSCEQLVYILINDPEYRNPQLAAHYLKKLASLGSVDAVTTLGALYYDWDLEYAKQLWIYASRMGNRDAQFHLGRHYYCRTENPDYNNALMLFQSAVEKGQTDAMLYLSVMYDLGLIVEKDNQKSFELLETSANLGNPSAMYYIAKRYLNGESGTIENKTLGMEWMEKAAKEGDQLAIDFLNDPSTDQNQ